MVFDSLLNYSRRTSDAIFNRRRELDPGSLGFAWDGPVQTYNEEAFGHFLALERKRAERSSRTFFLVLVSLKREPRLRVRFSPFVADRLFSGLSHCVREVDFVGWFRQGNVAGAVLAQGSEPSPPD